MRQLRTTVLPFGAGISLNSSWQEAEQRAAERSAQALGGSGASWRFEVRSGDPAMQLDLAARSMAQISSSSAPAGTRSPHRLLLGSVSTRLLHHGGRPGAGRPLSCRRHRR